MIQVASCEQASIKTNWKPLQNHQSKTLLLFKTYTLEFEFDRHLKHMFSYQEMQSGFPVFLVGEFGTFEICYKNYCLAKPDFSYFSNCKHKKIDRIWTENDHILPFTNHKSALLRFWSMCKAKNVDIWEKETQLNHLLVSTFPK